LKKRGLGPLFEWRSVEGVAVMFLRSVSFACLLFTLLTMLPLAGSQEAEHAAFEVVAIRPVKPQAPSSEVA
jgi:hypothetical protein